MTNITSSTGKKIDDSKLTDQKKLFLWLFRSPSIFLSLFRSPPLEFCPLKNGSYDDRICSWCFAGRLSTIHIDTAPQPFEKLELSENTKTLWADLRQEVNDYPTMECFMLQPRSSPLSHHTSLNEMVLFSEGQVLWKLSFNFPILFLKTKRLGFSHRTPRGFHPLTRRDFYPPRSWKIFTPSSERRVGKNGPTDLFRNLSNEGWNRTSRWGKIITSKSWHMALPKKFQGGWIRS